MLDLIILLACMVIAECIRQKMTRQRYDRVERNVKNDVSRWLKDKD